MNDRDRFKTLDAQRRALIAERAELYRVGTAEIMARIRAYKPRWKGDDTDIRMKAVDRLESWEITLLRAPISEAFRTHHTEISRDLRWIDSQLRRLAEILAVRVGAAPVWHVFREVWGSSYASQGYGARAYARGRADVEAEGLRLLGVDARVTERRRESTAALGARRRLRSDFLVEVYVADTVDVEILKRQPVGDLEAIARDCWQRGLNPRVYFPHLPHEAGRP